MPTGIRLTKLMKEGDLKKNHWVQCGPKESKGWFSCLGAKRKGREWGEIQGPEEDGKILVEWVGGMQKPTNCRIIAYQAHEPAELRRRMAVSSRRDSPVSLLEKIVAAQD